MLKSIQQWLIYPLLLLAAALLLGGCASGSGGEHSPAASSAAVQSPQPASTASPATGDAAASPVPSATADGTAAAAPATPGAATPGAAAASAAPATVAAAKPAATAKPAASAKPSAGAKPKATSKAVAPASPTAAAKPSAVPTAAPAKPAEAVNTVTLSIVGDSERGTILPAAAVEIRKGESVLDLLKRITRSHKIQMEYQGAKSFAYVEGIDNLYEFDHGPESGWVYKVNGKIPGKGAGSYTLNPGDTVEWLYTLDLGKDVGADVQ